jgi:hypothetical protein
MPPEVVMEFVTIFIVCDPRNKFVIETSKVKVMVLADVVWGAISLVSRTSPSTSATPVFTTPGTVEETKCVTWA